MVVRQNKKILRSKPDVKEQFIIESKKDRAFTSFGLKK